MQTLRPAAAGWNLTAVSGPTAAASQPTGAAGAGLWIDAAWLALLIVLSTTWCVTAARQLGGTYDETVYMECGLERWRTGSPHGLMRLGTMPLPVDVQTFPLHVMERMRGEPIDSKSEEYQDLLTVARLGNLVFWYMLLLYVWLGARALGGPWAGRIAVGFIALEPNLLAHASLATTDIALAACVLAFLYHFGQGLRGPWWKRVGVPGLFLGLATVAKVSGMVFGLLCVASIMAAQVWQVRDALWARRWWPGRAVLWPHFRDAAQMFGLALAFTFVYCGCDWEPQPSFVQWAHKLPDGTGKDVMVGISEHLCIFSNAGEGIVRQFTHNARGHGSYIAGQTNERALWYYFPLCLSIKSTIPMLLAPLAVLAAWRFSKARADGLNNWALLAALALLLFTPLCRVQIGVRFMFPLMALGVIGLSAVWARSAEQFGPVGRRRLAALTLVLLTWNGACAAQVWPHGLCYVNELWGGTEDGYRQVTDASYDWGQGLKDLKHWQEQSGEKEISVWYFGSDPTAYRAPFRNTPLHVLGIEKGDDVPRHVHTRYLAVSTTLLYGPYLNVTGREIRNYLLARQPVARTMTFFIYEFDPEERPGSETAEPPLANARQPHWVP